MTDDLIGVLFFYAKQVMIPWIIVSMSVSFNCPPNLNHSHFYSMICFYIYDR